MASAEPPILRGADGVYVPDFLTAADHPWLDALRDGFLALADRPRSEWTERQTQPLRCPAPTRKKLAAVRVLDQLADAEALAPGPSPADLRFALAEGAQAARSAGAWSGRGEVIARVGAAVGLDPVEVEARLLADLPSQRLLVLPDPLPDAHALALRTNLSIAQRLLRSASGLEIVLQSRSRALLRQVFLRRLLCTVAPRPDGVSVRVSGPFSLFRHTLVYGRALASVVPALRGAEGFRIRARCQIGGRTHVVQLGHTDPIFPPGLEPARFDSQLEERFARDLLKVAPGLDLSREPEPVLVGESWVFPDFALLDRATGRRLCLVEIVGFWTPEYLAGKLRRLAAAGRRDVLLCVDARLGCSGEDLPPGLPVVWFRRRVDVAGVLAFVQGRSA